MKKRKLLFLLTAVMCLSIPLSACDNTGDGSGAGSQEQPSTMEKYFVWEEETKAYSTIARTQGEVVTDAFGNPVYDAEHNLVAIRKTEVQNGSTMETVAVYDIANVEFDEGEVEFEPIEYDSITTSASWLGTETRSLDVTIDYPIIKFTETTRYDSDNDGIIDSSRVENDFYFAKNKNADGTYFNNVIAQNVADGSLVVQRNGSLYTVIIDGKVRWYNEDLTLVRELNKTQIEGYGQLHFQAGYKNHLYSWYDWSTPTDKRVIQVCDEEGVPSVEYTHPSDVIALANDAPMILNDGNILVQELTLADVDAIDYSHKMLLSDANGVGFKKVNMTTKIIDYKTGKATEIDCGYVINKFSSAYAGSEGFPFALQKAYQNQAYVTKIVNHELSTIEYVVLDNALNVEYTFENAALPTNNLLYQLSGKTAYDTIKKINAKQYVAFSAMELLASNSDAPLTVYNLKGEKVATLPYNVDEIYLNYYVAGTRIYDFNHTILFDLENYEPATIRDGKITVTAEEINGGIGIRETNNVTCEFTVYEFDYMKKDFVKVGDSKTEVPVVSEEIPVGNRITISDTLFFEDEDVDTYTWSFYNGAEKLLELQVPFETEASEVLSGDCLCAGGAYIGDEIDGVSYVYFIR